MQHRNRQVELLLDASVAGDGEMHLSELLDGVRPRCLKCDHGDAQAGHQCAALNSPFPPHLLIIFLFILIYPSHPPSFSSGETNLMVQR